MRVEYISHACLVIDAGGVRLATDPWWEGPCYAHQWNVFPRPVNAALVDQAQFLLISHGHADHLHEPTLITLRKDKTLYYPYYWYEGTIEWLRQMGFREVVEADSWKTCRVVPGVDLTFVVNGQDSMVVIEADGQVLVNVNDALHSSDPATISLFTSLIRKRWPKIDVLFTGFGGASYYPNVFHAPDKSDEAIARLREEFFALNFCRITAALNPKIAIPFAADFVLLHENQRWINAVRFPRERLTDYFDANVRPAGCTTRIVPMYSGDILDGLVLLPKSPYREKYSGGDFDELLLEQYPNVASAFTTPALIAESAAEDLARTIGEHVRAQVKVRKELSATDLVFSVEVIDAPSPRWYVVRCNHGQTSIAREAQAASESVARISTASAPLLHSLTEDWGADDLLIGYGCRIETASTALLPRARTCAELLMKYPAPGEYFRARPIRAARYMWQNRSGTLDKIKRKVSGIAGTGVVGSNCWITDPEERIRQQLGMPSPTGT